ncbi:MAG: hypothetical protein ACRD0H_30425, partial [Actinomycetes bacterium]
MIGGKVADPSALAAYIRGDSIALQAWLAVAKDRGIVLHIPGMALAEARAVHPDAGTLLCALLDHPWVVHTELSRTEAPRIVQLLAESRAWDGTAGHVVLVARERGWPVLSADPDRLRRIAPD